MEGKTIGSIVLVIIIIVGGWYLLSAKPAQAPTTTDQSPAVTNTTTTTTSTTTANSTTPAGVTVFYTAQGFSPKSVTVPLGTTVSFVNQSSGSMWVASAPHPTHQGYDGTTKDQHCVAGYSGPAPFDQCSAGSVFTFTFTKSGTFGYHNHASASDYGTITVVGAAL
jgi:plastocyanin